jgi:hypothetical protein
VLKSDSLAYMRLSAVLFRLVLEKKPDLLTHFNVAILISKYPRKVIVSLFDAWSDMSAIDSLAATGHWSR